MQALTIMIIAHNEYEWVKDSVGSIRKYNDIEELQVIVVDNYSDDELREWASLQTDFTYIFMDEGVTNYGRILNMVMEALNIRGDLLVMEGHYLLTPTCLSRMVDALYEKESVGAIGCMSNGFSYHQEIPLVCEDYDVLVEQTVGLKTQSAKRVLGLAPGIILFKAKALELVGRFDEHVLGTSSVMKDYCFRIVLENKELKVCTEAIMWDMIEEPYASIYARRFDNRQDEEYLEEKWGMRYFQYLYNENLISMIEKDSDAEFSVLEIGCDCGATLLEIGNRYPHAKLNGCDLNESSVRIASQFSEAFICNIEKDELPYAEGSMDYIIFGDVLEHLHDPYKTLKYCYKFLKAGGSIIASIPNVMHISIMRQLLKGDFTYTEVGLLDKTHIHLFTGNEIIKMFQKCGYEVGELGSATIPIDEEDKRMIDKLLELDPEGERYMYETFQYIVKGYKR